MLAVARAFPILALVGLAALAVGAGLGAIRGDGFVYFLHSYLVSYCFFLSISLGALFFVLMQHATRAGWSVAVRRLAENSWRRTSLCWRLLFLPILVPILLGNHALYAWTDSAAVADDPSAGNTRRRT